MNKKRYALAVYLLLGSIATILALTALNYVQSETLKNLLLNLSTELGGAALIFFIVNRLFLLEENDIANQISQLRREIDKKFSPLISGNQSRELFPVEDKLKNAIQVDLLGYNLLSLLRNIRQLLINEIIDGASVRILIVDLHSQAGRVMQQNSNKPHMIESDFILALDFICDMKQEIEAMNGNGSIGVKLVSWIPSCSLFIIKYSENEGIMKVTVHPPSFRLPTG